MRHSRRVAQRRTHDQAALDVAHLMEEEENEEEENEDEVEKGGGGRKNEGDVGECW